jgi:hypothetical protein
MLTSYADDSSYLELMKFLREHPVLRAQPGEHILEDVIDQNYPESRSGMVQKDKIIWSHWTHVMKCNIQTLISNFDTNSKKWSLEEIDQWCKSHRPNSNYLKRKVEALPQAEWENSDSDLDVIPGPELLVAKQPRLFQDIESQSQPAYHEKTREFQGTFNNDDHPTASGVMSHIYYQSSNSSSPIANTNFAQLNSNASESHQVIHQQLQTHSKLLTDILRKICSLESKLDRCLTQQSQQREGE